MRRELANDFIGYKAEDFILTLNRIHSKDEYNDGAEVIIPKGIFAQVINVYEEAKTVDLFVPYLAGVNGYTEINVPMSSIILINTYSFTPEMIEAIMDNEEFNSGESDD